MRNLIFLLGIMAAVQLNAQCYIPHIEKANAAYARGDYRNAHIQYDSALKCPDVRDYENGRLAREGKAKCQPILTINGKSNLDVNVSSSSGNKTFDVKSIRLSSWHASTNNNEGITINPSVYNGTLTLFWDANAQSTPREWLITISGEGGVEKSQATIRIIQAKSSFAVNGQTHLERSFSWEGGAARFDVSGVPSGQDYTISGIDATWMSVQKKDDHFFLIVSSNDSKVSVRKKTLTVTYNNQTAKIQISQSDCSTKEDLKAKARIDLGGLKVCEKSMIPYTTKGNGDFAGRIYDNTVIPYDGGSISSVGGYINYKGEITYIGSRMYFGKENGSYVNDKGDFIIQCGGIKPINEYCFFKVLQDSTVWEKNKEGQNSNYGYYTGFLYSKDKGLHVIGSYKFNEKDKTNIYIHIFKNDDFIITFDTFFLIDSIYTNRGGRSREFYKCVELRKSNGDLICKEYATGEPIIFEEGFSISNKLVEIRWRNEKKIKGKDWYEHYFITRNGEKNLLPDEIDRVMDISDGTVLFMSKKLGFGNERYGFCSLDGHIITKAVWRQAFPFSQDYAAVRDPESFLWTFIDKEGKKVFGRYGFYNARSFSEGLAAVVDRREGIIFMDKNRKVQLRLGTEYIMDSKLDMLYRTTDYKLSAQQYKYKNGIAIFVRETNSIKQYGFIDKQGKWITNRCWDMVTPMKNGLAGIKDGSLWGILDIKGDVVVPPSNVSIPTFNYDGTVILIGANTLLTVDSMGNKYNGMQNEHIRIVSTGPTHTPSIFSVNNVYGYFNDTLGIVTIPPSFNDALPFSEDLAAVKIGSKWGYIDKTGEIVIPTVFEQARPFNNGRADVVIDEKKYFIDKKGTILND